MRTAPTNLTPELLRKALAEGWLLRGGYLKYVPEGGGSHHWKMVDADGQPHFITVDDLDDKDWIGDTRERVFEGLGCALTTAAALRSQAGLEFVVAPIESVDGEVLRRVDNRYAVSVYPFLSGRSYPFGPYPDDQVRDMALDMIVELHQSTTSAGQSVPDHEPRYGGQWDLSEFLEDPHRRWTGGPFSEPARCLLISYAADLVQLVAGFDRLVERTATARARRVVTHGEPHPANVMLVEDRLVLIDWDTVALAPPERDLSVIVATSNACIDRYQTATGREIDPAVLTLYRLRWYLDDLASAVSMFRNHHGESADTRRWWKGLQPHLDQLSGWINLLGEPSPPPNQ